MALRREMKGNLRIDGLIGNDEFFGVNPLGAFRIKIIESPDEKTKEKSEKDFPPFMLTYTVCTMYCTHVRTLCSDKRITDFRNILHYPIVRIKVSHQKGSFPSYNNFDPFHFY